MGGSTQSHEYQSVDGSLGPVWETGYGIRSDHKNDDGILDEGVSIPKVHPCLMAIVQTIRLE